jgi:xanthine dehydrogenase accessory factor
MMRVGAADHRRILQHAREWAGASMALATVVETWRSAPCPLGTHMLVHEDGRFVGSVSGGCVEGDVLETARIVIETGTAQIRRYGVAEGAAWEAGLPCGGDIVVLVQKVCAEGFPPELFDEIETTLSQGRTLSVATRFDQGTSALGEEGDFVNRYLPPRRLLIIGAVEIAAALSDLARALGIEVTLIDPRGRFLTPERFPGVTLDDRWPDQAVAAHAPDSRTAIVTLSHDPKIDDPALVAALDSTAGYIAALGSQTSHAARSARLTAAGIDPAELARIEGPAGVAINSISAPEIALSIAGGIIRALNHDLR